MTERGKEREPSIVLCPNCGTKNSMSVEVCIKCSFHLVKAKEIVTARACKEQYVKNEDGSIRYLVLDDLKIWANEARAAEVCIACGKSITRGLLLLPSFTCGFCGGTLCFGCMRDRSFAIAPQLLTHLGRLGLIQFPGWTGIENSGYMDLPSGYYLCKNCVYFINGPEMVKYLDSYYKRTGRLEELAELREYQGLLDEAKRIRLAARSHAPPDLSKLIDKLREEGMAVPYKCPSCGANITIDSDVDAAGLKFCSYCGTAVNIDALAKAIEASLKF